VTRLPAPGQIHQQARHIAVVECLVHCLLHALVQGALPTVHAWRVEQQRLPIRAGHDAEDPTARGLGLVGHDREAFAHQSVHQRGLAGIR